MSANRTSGPLRAHPESALGVITAKWPRALPQCCVTYKAGFVPGEAGSQRRTTWYGLRFC
jgi:hypothetical protein